MYKAIDSDAVAASLRPATQCVYVLCVLRVCVCLCALCVWFVCVICVSVFVLVCACLCVRTCVRDVFEMAIVRGP